MTRYYFDMRDDDGVTIDDEGMELSSLQQVQEEAARSLAGMARDAVVRLNGSEGHRLAIEVRDDSGPLMRVRFSFEVDRLRKH